jgi:hypothetical protein
MYKQTLNLEKPPRWFKELSDEQKEISIKYHTKRHNEAWENKPKEIPEGTFLTANNEQSFLKKGASYRVKFYNAYLKSNFCHVGWFEFVTVETKKGLHQMPLWAFQPPIIDESDAVKVLWSVM